jgi:hypothetical protein
MNTTISPEMRSTPALHPTPGVRPLVGADVRGAVSTTASESGQSAVAWGAILCGAVVASAVSLVLIAIGTGLNLASISPWPGAGVTATTFTAMTAVWFIVVQWIASGVGGYLAGRLRTKWVGVHTHEVFFRDTAHGFTTWALGSLLIAVALSTSVTSLLAGGGRVAAAAGTSATDSRASGGYDLDVLLRGSADNAGSQPDLRPEAMRILTNSLASNEGVPNSDRTYLAEQVAARTGISQSEAQQRVDGFISNAKAAADQARKVAAAVALFTAISMLVGAFIACVAAALGGLRRDAPAVS